MAIKHVVTAGYGFADATIYIPTHGFTPAAATATPIVTIALTARYEPTIGLVCRNEPTLHLPATYRPTIDLTARVAP